VRGNKPGRSKSAPVKPDYSANQSQRSERGEENIELAHRGRKPPKPSGSAQPPRPTDAIDQGKGRHQLAAQLRCQRDKGCETIKSANSYGCRLFPHPIGTTCGKLSAAIVRIAEVHRLAGAPKTGRPSFGRCAFLGVDECARVHFDRGCRRVDRRWPDRVPASVPYCGSDNQNPDFCNACKSLSLWNTSQRVQKNSLSLIFPAGSEQWPSRRPQAALRCDTRTLGTPSLWRQAAATIAPPDACWLTANPRELS
jgi:hypothetical protein